MVLTPEDVINKTFQPTRFAEGYNQDEVDEFLDEVVTALRALHGQIAELEGKLKEASEPLVKTQPEPSAAQRAVEDDAGAEVTADAALAGGPVAGGAGEATGMLLLAQRLHDEHVQNGQKQRDELLADAKATAERLLKEAEEKRAGTMSSLELERSELQGMIAFLREHEQEYRTRLRSLLQAQLSDLDSQQTLEPADGPNA